MATAIETSIPDEPEILPPDDGAPDIAPPDAGDPAVEARAREMGWKPLAEYRGPPGKWQPAAQFIERGENILPIVRQQNRALTERLGKLEGEVTGLRNTASEQLQIIKDLREMGRTASKRGYDQAMAEIKAKQRAAVEAGDTKSYDQLVDQAEALESERPAAAVEPVRPAAEPPARPSAPALREPTKNFIADNPWFSNNKLLADTMIALHQEVLSERQANDASLIADPALERELLEEAKARVVERYPERFGMARKPTSEPTPRPQNRRAASVAAPTAGDPPPPRNGSAQTINSIADPADRAEAREAFNRMKRNMPDYTEAEYMAVYADPHSDILSMQHQAKARANGR